MLSQSISHSNCWQSTSLSPQSNSFDTQLCPSGQALSDSHVTAWHEPREQQL